MRISGYHPPKLPSRPWGWIQKQSRTISAVQRIRPLSSELKPPNCKQPRKETIDVTHGITLVNCQKAIISCHHILDLKGNSALNREGYIHQFKSRAYKSLQTKLGLVNAGLLGDSDSSGVPFAPSCPASPVFHPISDAFPSKATELDIDGGGRNAGETGNFCGTAQQGQLHIPDICDPQERWGLSPSGP